MSPERLKYWQSESKKTNHARIRTQAWKRLRAAVFLRDMYRCRLCGQVTPNPQCDHIIPRRRGGQDTLESCQTLCWSCHSRKTARGD